MIHDTCPLLLGPIFGGLLAELFGVRWFEKPLPEFSPVWREFLRENVDFYADLSDADKGRFEERVARFLADQTITGLRGADVSDETKLLIASSAIILVFGIPDFVYPVVRDIVVYPAAFNDEYKVAARSHIAGMVHAQGPILFSESDLKVGFKKDHDGYNVGLHEFAHVLDFGHEPNADGVPATMPWKSLRPWTRLMATEMARIEQDRSVLRDYGAKNEAEFFAVATEYFFERPRALKAKHPKVYAFLAEAFQQDPASRAESTGR